MKLVLYPRRLGTHRSGSSRNFLGRRAADVGQRGFSQTEPKSHRDFGVFPTFAGITAAFLSLVATTAVPAKTIHERETRYHYIQVDESRSIRTLQFRRKGTNYDESSVDMKDPLNLVLSYSRLMFSGFLFVPEPKSILMVGLGAGTCPRVMNHYFPQAKFEVVELDSDVLEVATQYFGFKQNANLKVTVNDGRKGVRLLKRQKRKYDLVMLDAFRGGYIPAHLTTKEFLDDCRALLTPTGALVSNLWPSLELYEYERRTMAKVFPKQYSFGRYGNKIVVCLQRDPKLTQDDLRSRAKQIMEKRKLSFDLANVVAEMDLRTDYRATGDILTDDYSPANVLNSIPKDRE